MITFPTNTTEIIDQIRYAIGRLVTFQVITSGVPCSSCGVNPFLQNGINPFCPTCSGEGFIYTFDFVSVSGHVTWGERDIPEWARGGLFFTGDCRIQVKYTDEILDVLERTKYVFVDGVRLRIVSKIFRGVPNINRILIDLKQED